MFRQETRRGLFIVLFSTIMIYTILYKTHFIMCTTFCPAQKVAKRLVPGTSSDHSCGDFRIMGWACCQEGRRLPRDTFTNLKSLFSFWKSVPSLEAPFHLMNSSWIDENHNIDYYLVLDYIAFLAIRRFVTFYCNEQV